MVKPRILLIQVRDPDDSMVAHERECIGRRLGEHAVEITTRNALESPPQTTWLRRHDALIVGGSGDYSVHHPRSDKLVSRLRHVLDVALTKQLPGFGICFGHQLVGFHFGSAVDTDDHHAELGTIDVELTDAGARDTLFSSLERCFPVHTGHSDHVGEVPNGLRLLARNDLLETQAFKVQGAPFYTTQFHPDLTGAEAIVRGMAYLRSLAAAIPTTAADGVTRFRAQADAAVVLLARFAELLAHDE